MTKTTMPGMQFNVLCDGSHQNDSTGIGGLSVSRSGQYITLASTADSGAAIFAVDKTATQVFICCLGHLLLFLLSLLVSW